MAPKNQTIDETVAVEEEPDIVSLQLEPISGNGTGIIKFSEPLMVPDMLWKKYDTTTNTTVEDFSFVNLATLMEFNLYQKDDSKDEEFDSKFYTELKNWDSNKMVIYFNFTMPMEISTGPIKD